MHVWNVLQVARWKYRTQKSPFSHHRATLSGCIFAAETCIENRKNLLNNDISSTCPRNMVNFGLLTAEICWRVWGTPANFNGFRVLAALLHGTLVVGVSQTLRRSTEGATYIRQGDHHVRHWPTFCSCDIKCFCMSILLYVDDILLVAPSVTSLQSSTALAPAWAGISLPRHALKRKEVSVYACWWSF